MSKKKPPVTQTGMILSRIRSITKWMNENQSWVYVAIIGFCLSVTILYKLFQWYGL